MPSGAGDDPKVRRPASAAWMTEVPLRVPILTKFGNSAGVHPEIREAVSRICDLHHVLLRKPSRMWTVRSPRVPAARAGGQDRILQARPAGGQLADRSGEPRPSPPSIMSNS